MFKYLLVLVFVKFGDSNPIDFEDDWDYKVEPQNEPLLNGSKQHYVMPIYSFARELKIEGLSPQIPQRVARGPKVAGDIMRSRMSCNVCNLGVGLLYREVKGGTSFDEIKGKFVSLCVTFKIETASVCSGVFDTYGPEVMAVLEVIEIEPKEICKLVFGELCPVGDVLTHEWVVEVPANKPPVVPTPLPEPSSPIFKVLHLSDTHLDLDYEEMAPANCEEPLCCRNYSTLRSGEQLVPAGKWGSYEKCDAPQALLQNMFNHIALQHPDLDYILWTGDLPPHDIWNQTKQSNLNTIKATINMVIEAFPETPIFPAVGNHEASPAGNFAPSWMKNPLHSTGWLYEELSKSWSKWLPAGTSSINHGAFYSVLLRPKFRIISINTNYCHSLSWWLLVNSTDPASELKWLTFQLQQAEINREKVHLIGHIAPGSSDCMKTWSRNFYEIINRFEGVVAGLFYGHSHSDEFEVFYDGNEDFSSRPTAVAYLGPSATSYTNNNPAYRVYYIDGDHDDTTREVLDHETWTFDLNTANMEGAEPQWYKLYSAKEAYAMESLRAEQWDKLIKNLAADDDLFDVFYRNYHRNSPETPQCDKKCKSDILCSLKSAKSHSKSQLCNEIK